MFDVNKAINAQKKYCEDKNYPHFAPRNGMCWKCNKNIYEEKEKKIGENIYKTGITVEKASSKLVTGCPHCNISYCD